MAHVTDPYTGITFNLKQLLGQGTYGKVYQATSNEIPPKTVAIKILKFPTELNIFNESGLLTILSKNSVICKRYIACLKSNFTFNNQYYFVYDFIPGQNLYKIITNTSPGKRITDYGGLAVAINTCKGLDYIHRLGVYHQDIKTENMMFDSRDGLVKFVDWGSTCGAIILGAYFPGNLKQAFNTRHDAVPTVFQDVYPGDLVKTHINNLCGYTGSLPYASPELVNVLAPETVNKILKTEYTHPMLPVFRHFVYQNTRDSATNNILGQAHDIWSLGCVLLEWYSDLNHRDVTTLAFSKYFKYDYYFTLTDSQRTNMFRLLAHIPIVRDIVPLMLEINPYTRIENWTQVMAIINNYCIENPANIGCPSAAENNKINEYTEHVFSNFYTHMQNTIVG